MLFCEGKADLGGDGIKVIEKKSDSSSESSGDILGLIHKFEVTVSLSDFRYLKRLGKELELLPRVFDLPHPSSFKAQNSVDKQ